MNNLLDNINESPQILLKLLQSNNKEVDAVTNYIRDKNVAEVILVGSGTSYHAGLFVEKVFNEHTTVVFKSYYPYEVEESNRILHDKLLVIGLSQSGTSSSTHAALSKAKQYGATTVLISSNINSKIKEVSDYFIYLDCGEEAAVAKTKGFSASCGILYRLALGLSKDKDILYSDLISVTKNLNESIVLAEKWMKKNQESLKDVSHLYVVGSAEHIGLLKETTLKFIETIRIPVVGFELEEFMHGIYNAITDNSYILFINSSSKYSSRILKLYEYMSKKTEHCYLIDDNIEKYDNTLKLFNEKSDRFKAFHFTVAVQVICHYGALARGIDPTKSGDVAFHSAMKSKVS